MASKADADSTLEGLPPLKDALLRYMSLCSTIIGYDASNNNSHFAKVFKEKVFQTMTLEENIRLLSLGFILNIR